MDDDSVIHNHRREGHAIRVASRRTGLSQHVIRVWERRYRAVTPRRTDTNRRLYTDADIERLRLLEEARQAGHAISRIAGLTNEEIQKIIDVDRRYNPSTVESASPRSDVQNIIDSCLSAVKRLDSTAFEEELAHAMVNLNVSRVLEEVVLPLLVQIGDNWHSGHFRVADEHMATAVLRSFLGSVRELRRAPAGGPKMVVTTPAGQIHELGALVVAALASVAGWNSIYLGPNLPADEIAGAVLTSGADVLAMSLVHPADDPLLPSELSRIRRGLGTSVTILTGGSASLGYADTLQDINAVQINDSLSLSEQLAGLRYG